MFGTAAKYRKSVYIPIPGPSDGEIRVHRQSVREAVHQLVDAFERDKKQSVVLSGLAQAFGTVVAAVEAAKRRVPGLHQITRLGALETSERYEPLEEGLDPVFICRKLSTLYITLTLSPTAEQRAAPGYQAPLPTAEVLKEIDMGQFAFDEAAALPLPTLLPPAHVPVHVHLQNYAHGHGHGHAYGSSHLQHHGHSSAADSQQRRPGYGRPSSSSHLRPSRDQSEKADQAQEHDHPPRAPASSRSARSDASAPRQATGGRRPHHGSAAAATAAESAAGVAAEGSLLSLNDAAAEPVADIAAVPVSARAHAGGAPPEASVGAAHAAFPPREAPVSTVSSATAASAPAVLAAGPTRAPVQASAATAVPASSSGHALDAAAVGRAEAQPESASEATASLSPSFGSAAASDSASVISSSPITTESGCGSPAARAAELPASLGAVASAAAPTAASSAPVAASVAPPPIVLAAAPALSSSSVASSRSAEPRGHAQDGAAASSGGGGGGGLVGRVLAAAAATPSSFAAAAISSLALGGAHVSSGSSAVKLIGFTTIDGATPLPLSSLVPTSGAKSDPSARPSSAAATMQAQGATTVGRSYASVLRK